MKSWLLGCRSVGRGGARPGRREALAQRRGPRGQVEQIALSGHVRCLVDDGAQLPGQIRPAVRGEALGDGLGGRVKMRGSVGVAPRRATWGSR